MLVLDSTIPQIISSLALIMNHSYYLQSYYKNKNVHNIIATLSFHATIFNAFKFGNKKQDLRQLFKQNIVFITFYLFVSFFVDKKFVEKVKKQPLYFLFRWYTMSITLKDDTVQFLNRYTAHLWFICNNIIYVALDNMLTHEGRLLAFACSLYYKVLYYKPIPENYDISKAHDFENEDSNNKATRFLYTQHHNPLAWGWAFFLGSLCRRMNLLRLKNIYSNEFIQTWMVTSALFHIPFVFKFNKLTKNPFMTFLLVNATMLGFTTIIKK